MKRYNDKRVFITGAASGIGRATAIRLASEGAALYITDVNEEGLTEVATQCVAVGASVERKRLDVSQKADVEAAIEDCVSRLGGIDVLCNIAGVLLIEHFDKNTPEQIDWLLKVNFFGTIFPIQAALPHLITSKGNIVNCSSQAAWGGAIYSAVYGATKAAVSALTRGLAIEFASKGVRCNSVAPGTVVTPMITSPKIPEDADFALMGRRPPLNGVNGTPEQIASVIALLGSEDGGYINGADLPADGGALA